MQADNSASETTVAASHRDIPGALSEAQRMVEIIMTPEPEVSASDREWIAEETYKNFANHINKGFLEYRKSVTETDDFALTDWFGQGSILRDVMGREYIDMLGGFGLYSPGIRHPEIVAAAKAQLDRSPAVQPGDARSASGTSGQSNCQAHPRRHPVRLFCQQRHRSR